MAAIGVPFDDSIVASEIGSYKPAEGHWRAFEERRGRLPDVHVAASLFHDVVPPPELGIPCVWINRLDESADGLAPTRELPDCRPYRRRSMSSSLPEGWRPLRPADAPAVAEMLEEDEREHGYPGKVSADDVRSWWRRTKLDEDSWALEEDGDRCARPGSSSTAATPSRRGSSGRASTGAGSARASSTLPSDARARGRRQRAFGRSPSVRTRDAQALYEGRGYRAVPTLTT